VQDLMKEATAKGGNQVEFHDYFKYRISYISEKEQQLMFLFVTGLTDNFDNIKKELIKCKKEFLNLFEDLLQHKYDSKTFEVFDPTIDAIHRNLRPKISLVGFSGVGKTTITRLIKAEEIPMQHIPTITGDIATIKIGKLHFHLWDFAGQEQFSYLWNNFIKGSDAVLLITDSTLENVEKSKFFLELIKEQAPNAHSSIIANKQDLEDAMSPNQIEKILGLKTYSMIAKEESNRDKMITIIADILEMSAEVSPLLKPLLERDNLIELATNALQNAEFEGAATHFEKISDLCIELGDDSLGREFYDKAAKIKEMLNKVKTPPTEEVAQSEEVEAMPVITETPEVKKEPPMEKLTPPPLPPKPPVPKKVPISPQEEQLRSPKSPPSFKPSVAKDSDVVEPKAEPQPVPTSEESLQETSDFRKIETEPLEQPEPEEPIDRPDLPVKGKLNLKPEDFMIQQRPKTVITVPKDAKEKLKTSPYAPVTNPTVPQPPKALNPVEEFRKKIKESTPKIEKPEAKQTFAPSKPTTFKPFPPTMETIPKDKSQPPIPVSPTELIKQKPMMPTETIKSTPIIPPSMAPTPTPIVSPPIESVKPASVKVESTSPEQKASLERSLMDLKIKKASISKMALDLDMKELTGEITEDELTKKKSKLVELEAKVDQQIKDLEKLLGQ
jgi:ADP-ribosylation factor-like protein 1